MSGKDFETQELIDEIKNLQNILRSGGKLTNGQIAMLEAYKQSNTILNVYDVKSRRLVWDSRLNASNIERCFKQTLVANIRNSNHNFELTDETKVNSLRISEWLFNQQKPFLILQGTYGNGKTSSARSILQVIRANNFKHKNFYGDVTENNLVVCEYDACSLFEDLVYNKVDKDKISSLPVLFIDDLGVEPSRYNHFGTILTPIHDVLRVRQEKGLITIITTNLTAKMMKDYYGERIFDRLKESGERVLFTQHSFRGKEDNDFIQVAQAQ